MARTLRALAAEGRDGFYGGEFGQALLRVGVGEYSPSDLESPLAEWVEPVALRASATTCGRCPRRRRGTSRWRPLGGRAGGPPLRSRRPPVGPRRGRGQPGDGRGPSRRPLRRRRRHRAAVAGAPRGGAGVARPERADPRRVARPARREADARGERRASGDGDTTHLCAADADGLAISLTQSNALDFGAHIVAGDDRRVPAQPRASGSASSPGTRPSTGPCRRPPTPCRPPLPPGPTGR